MQTLFLRIQSHHLECHTCRDLLMRASTTISIFREEALTEERHSNALNSDYHRNFKRISLRSLCFFPVSFIPAAQSEPEHIKNVITPGVR